ncbi:MAG TPA: RNA methyltransferase [Chitinophagales bacterium]
MRKLLNEELGRLDIAEFQEAEKIPLILILDSVRSHLNVGSVFRTADAFRIEKIYLCGITGTPPHRDIQKTALGATETVAWEYRENILQLVDELKAQNVFIASIEQAEKSTYLHRFSIPENQKLAVIFGNEVEGVSQDVVSASNVVIEIPQFGTKHSLNISVSAGMVVWELAKQYLF